MKTEQLEKLLKSTIWEDNLIGFTLLKDCTTLEDIFKICPYAKRSKSDIWPGLVFSRNYRIGEEVYYRINKNILVYTGQERLIFRDINLQYNGGLKIIDL